MARIGIATEVIDVLQPLFSGLLKGLNIGDQVPGLPIKSKNTQAKIINDVSNALPPPKSIEDAKMLLAKAKQYAAEAYAKGGDVNTSYGIMFDMAAAELQKYISGGGYTPVAQMQPGGNTVYTPQSGTSNRWGEGPAPAPEKNNTLLYVLIGSAALFLFMRKK